MAFFFKNNNIRRFVDSVVRDAPPGEDIDTIEQHPIFPSISSSPSHSFVSSSSDGTITPLQYQALDCRTLTPPALALPADCTARHEVEDINQFGNSILIGVEKSEKIADSEIQLRCLAHIFERYSTLSFVSSDGIVSALREVADIMVWADQYDSNELWDVFMECGIMSLFIRCLRACTSTPSTNRSKYRQVDVKVNDQHHMEIALENAVDKAMVKGLELALEKAVAKIDPTVSSVTAKSMSAPAISTSIKKTTFSNDITNNNNIIQASRSSPIASINDTPITKKSISSYEDESWKIVGVKVQSQILQTLSIMIQSCQRHTSLVSIFSSNYINEILSFQFTFSENEEIVQYLISTIKTISIKLDSHLLQLFFNPSNSSTFPIYDIITKFHNHPDNVIRIAVRNVTLTLCSLGDDPIVEYIKNGDYLCNMTSVLQKLCGKVSRSLEILMNDGKQVDSKVIKISNIEDMLEEINDMIMYLNDLSSISENALNTMIETLLRTEIFIPLFSPLSSYACSNRTDRLDIFDAISRTLLLAFLLRISKGGPVSFALLTLLYWPVEHFGNRNVIHGLKVMSCDTFGTERMTVVSLAALRYIIDSITPDLLRWLNLDMSGEDDADLDYNFETEVIDDTMLMNLRTFHVGTSSPSPSPSPRKQTSTSLPTSPLPFTDYNVQPSLSSTPSTTPGPLMRLFSSSSIGRGIINVMPGSASSNNLQLASATNDKDNDNDNDKEINKLLRSGHASMIDILSNILLTVRNRELRSKRVVLSVCNILQSINECNNNERLNAIYKMYLNHLSRKLLIFLNDRDTTIVCIERAFLSFQKSFSSCIKIQEIFGDIEFVGNVIKMAKECPSTGGRKRRSSKLVFEDVDADMVVMLIEFYQKNLYQADKIMLMDLCKVKLEECSLMDSYLDKRDALVSVAVAIGRHGN